MPNQYNKKEFTTYKSAGVDIDEGNAMVRCIAPLVKSTHNSRVLSNIGHFGGFYDAMFPDYEHPVLVASTDGVGTKLKIAFMLNKHNTIGQCLVNHCVNDILCCGAVPLFFLDYFATGKLDVNIAVSVIEGFTIACKKNNCALIGGETAEMPSIYYQNEYDIGGSIIGIADKSKIINGNDIKSGDLLIGLSSTGLHTNGYSLARAVLFPKYDINQYIEDIGSTLGEALLAVHRSYLHQVAPLMNENLLTGISHITGGGIIGNTSRILPDNCKLDINWDSWERLPIFDIIQKAGNIEEAEMRRAFNLGMGMILICRESNADKIFKQTNEFNPIVIGRITN